MTLTEMIRAHDGGPMSVDLANAMLEQIRKKSMPAGFWADVELALTKNDLNAAWRLLPEGWEWDSLSNGLGGRRWNFAHAFGPDNKILSEKHKQSLPCAMVLAAIQAHGVK